LKTKLGTVVILILILIVHGGGYIFASSPEDVLLKLNVRVSNVSNNSGPEKDLTLKDFELRLNDIPQPVVEFHKRSKSMDNIQQGRYFTLSFDVNGYGKPLSDAVSYFINHILAPSDGLLVRSPLHVYKINPGTSKQDILEFIKTNLEKDILRKNQDKNILVDALNRLMKDIESKLDGNPGKKGIEPVQFFLNYFDTEWNMLCTRFLLSNLDGFVECASQMNMEDKENEKWLIHFHEREGTSLQNEFLRVYPKVRKFISGITDKKWKDKVPSLLEKLDAIEKSLHMVETVPVQEWLNSLLNTNITCNVVFLDPGEIFHTDGEVTFDYGFDDILKTVTLYTGGVSISKANPSGGLAVIKKNTDYYYELVFGFDGKAEDKNIEINIPQNTGSVYSRNMFKKEEFARFMEVKGRNLSILGYNLQGHTLAFDVSGVRTVSSGDSRVKVGIGLMDDTQAVVYETSNTLKPGGDGDKISISVNLPQEYKGYYKLVITAVHPGSGRTCELKEYIKL
jgi:hypothetical protein